MILLGDIQYTDHHHQFNHVNSHHDFVSASESDSDDIFTALFVNNWVWNNKMEAV